MAAAVLLAAALSGCSGLKPPADEPAPAPTAPPAVQPAPSPTPPVRVRPDREARLRTAVADWIGTPHRLGGTDRHGIDCSAFVRRLYRTVFDLELPRTTAQQVQLGRPVTRGKMRTGDLVFFQPDKKYRHVGVYLSRGEFAHASKSRGVTISQMDNPYWKRVLLAIRRILPPYN